MRTWPIALAVLYVLTHVLACRADNRIFIPVKINDRPVRFIFDTGAADTYLWRSAADRLGLQLTPAPQDAVIKAGQAPMSLSEPLKLEVAGHILNSVTMGVVENPPQPTDFDGLVGWANLRSNRQIFRGETLDFIPVAEWPAETAQWAKLQERMDSKILVVELPGKRSGQPAYLAVDTGSTDGVALAPDEWEKWHKANSGQPTTLLAYFTPGAGLVVSEVSWADKFDLWGLTLRGVPVARMDSAVVALSPPGTVALVGLAALRRMNMYFDGAGAVFVQTSETPPPPYSHNRLGAVFLPGGADQNDLVAQVAKGSPASKAGVRDGDVLLKIDQLDVTPWRTQPGILPLGRFWEQAPGTKMRLTLRRSGKPVAADVELRNILGPVEGSSAALPLPAK